MKSVLVGSIGPVRYDRMFRIVLRGKVGGGAVRYIHRIVRNFFRSTIRGSFVAFGPMAGDMGVPIRRRPGVEFLAIRRRGSFLRESGGATGCGFFTFTLRANVEIDRVLTLA